MLAAAGGPWHGEARCCAVVAFSSHASICGDIFISWGTRFSPYGDTVNLSRCFYYPAILTLCVNPQLPPPPGGGGKSMQNYRRLRYASCVMGTDDLRGLVSLSVQFGIVYDLASLEKSLKSLEQKRTASDRFSCLMVTGTVMLNLFTLTISVSPR